MSDEPTTLLVLTGMGVPPYSARGLKQVLEPIPAASKLERASNGGLLDLSPPQMRKYKSEISGSDQQGPAINAIWPGKTILTVDCIVEIPIPLGAAPERQVVDSRIEGDFLFYRPRLVMRVVDYSVDVDEWTAVIGWKLLLEEE
jgi:hypothetical protein